MYQPMFSLCPNPMMLQGLAMPPPPTNTMDVYLPRPDQPIAEFLYQLTKMLTVENKEVIEWSNGRIKVHDPPKLAKEVLHKYFRHSKYASFQRQLNYFGFRKLAGKAKMSPCSYINDEATEDLRSLLFIKRKTSGTAGKKNANSSENDKTSGGVKNGVNVSTSENEIKEKSQKRKKNLDTQSSDGYSDGEESSKRSRLTSPCLSSENLSCSLEERALPLPVGSAPLPMSIPAPSTYMNAGNDFNTIVTDSITSTDYSSSSTYNNDTRETERVQPLNKPSGMDVTAKVPGLGETFHFLSSNTLSALAKMNQSMCNNFSSASSMTNSEPSIEVRGKGNDMQGPLPTSYIGVGPVSGPGQISDNVRDSINAGFQGDIQNAGNFYYDPLTFIPTSSTQPSMKNNEVRNTSNNKGFDATQDSDQMPRNSSFISVSELLRRDPSILDFSTLCYNPALSSVEPTPIYEMSSPSE